MIQSRTMKMAVAALALCVGGSVFAQQNRRDFNSPLPQYQQGQQPAPNVTPGFDRNAGRNVRNDDRRSNDRNDNYRGQQDFRDGRYADRRGYPQPHSEWRRGGRVPQEYRGRNYVVDDWRGHRLQQPPRGYQWVGVGGDFVLAAIATGLIAQIITSQ